MRKERAGFWGLIGLLGALTFSSAAAIGAESGIITFDVPGADTHAGDYNGTYPNGINSQGAVTGYYINNDDIYVGFLRTADGKIARFGAPGAGTTKGSYTGTYPTAINDLGQITGFSVDMGGTGHAFLLSPTGQFTVFDVPNSVGSYPYAINLQGEVTGYYADAGGQYHAFVRKTDGTVVSFDGPNVCTGGASVGCYGSATFTLNVFGAAVGSYADDKGNFVSHGLLRSPAGKLLSFDAPGAGSGVYQGTGCPGCAFGMNASGAIAGLYIDSNNVYHSFLRSPEGSFTTFDAPGAGSAPNEGTGCANDCILSLNDAGEISGEYVDSKSIIHGFFRYANGTIQSVDPTGSIGTYPSTINQAGVMTGIYLDEKKVYRGFIRSPSSTH